MERSFSHFEAIGFAIFGFTLWVLSDACMKLAGEAALPSYEIVGFLGLAGTIFMLLKTGIGGKTKTLWPKRPAPQLGRALICFANNLLNAIALKHLPLTLFYIIAFASPIVIAILAAFVLHERLTWQKSLAIIGGFLGVTIAIDPFGHTGSGDWVGYFAMSGAVLCCAVNIVWLRVMTQSETIDSLTFFTSFVELAVGFGCMLWHAEPLTLSLLLVLTGMGLFCVTGNICNFIAVKNTTAAMVYQFHYTQIITGAVIGYIIWQEVPTLHLFVGITVIVGSGLYIAAHAHRTEKRARLITEKP